MFEIGGYPISEPTLREAACCAGPNRLNRFAQVRSTSDVTGQVNDPNVGVLFLANNFYKNNCRAEIMSPLCSSCQDALNDILFV